MRKSGFSSLCRPGTHFKDAQSPQWACTKIGFSIFIQKRTTAIYRVEHQKSVRIAKKIWKKNNRFSEVIKKVFDHHLPEKSRSTHNHRKSGYFALMKLINRYRRIRFLKSTSVFKEDTRTHLKIIIEETWCPRRRNKNEHFLLISVHADMETKKRSTIKQRMSNSSPFVVISLLEQNCKRFSKSAIKKYNVRN